MPILMWIKANNNQTTFTVLVFSNFTLIDQTNMF